MRLIILLIFIINFSFAQNNLISGVVTDYNNIPLESANVIARSLGKNPQIKFAIADNKGRYKIELDQNITYEITVSYIGYQENIFTLTENSQITEHNFILKSTGQNLKEIVLKHEYVPILLKKDTVTFTAKAFANGNERKLKELLEKLPGMEVDKKGGVTFQGKKVTKMMVEGKSFFGGGTKLAVENIPADALDKIEMIDNFNQVGFMKEVSDSRDLAMNVKLKADKKEFVFGDVDAGLSNKNYYLGHTGLFYYAPKTNVSFIGDINNIGKSTFTFDDLMRFDGGISSFLNSKKSFSNLFAFANDNTDVVQNKAKFGATNFSFDISPKFNISGYAILSKVFTESKNNDKNTYLQNSFLTFEQKNESNNNRSTLGIVNIKLDYSFSKNEKLNYNMQFQSSNNNVTNNIESTTNINNTLFENYTKTDNLSIKQFAEWQKSINSHNKTTFVINQIYDNNKPINEWFTNAPFLSGLIPLQADSNYRINQISNVTNNNVDALFKHYWIINNSNHIYSIIGNNYINSKIKTTEQQLLTNGIINDFKIADFGNNINSNFNDAYIGLEYKFKIGKWTNKPGLYLHFYNLISNQFSIINNLSKTLLLPQWNSEFEINKSESLKFSYQLANKFPETNQLANKFTLQSYNSVFKGNTLLENEYFHNATLDYNKFNSYRNINVYASASFNKKIKTIRNEIVLDNINQYSTPFLTDNPETNWRINGSISKKIYKFYLKLNSNLNGFNYIQTLNNISQSNNRNSQVVGISLKTASKKYPDFTIGYIKSYNQINGISNANFQSDRFNSDLEATIYKSWVFKIDYENLKNTNSNNQNNYFDIINSSLRYQKKNSPFGFEITANNLLNNNLRNSYSFSDFLISEEVTFVLPRVLLLSVSYKL